jgi:hypothetical protein
MTKRLEINPENPEGVLVDLTAEEIAQKETDKTNWETEKAQAATEAEAKVDLKASAKAKLIAGEALTEAEADTLVI